MKNTYQKFMILPLALLIAFSPTLSYAKEKESREERSEKKEQVLKFRAEARVSADDDKDDDREDKDEDSNKTRKSCVKAFGHLIAPGYIKNRGEIEIDFWRDCVIPFGILKKLNGFGTTTPPTIDITAPVISNVSVSTGTSTAQVSWKTNEKATSTVYWSTLAPLEVGATTTASSTSNIRTRNHLVSIAGLSATTTYYFKIFSSDARGNISTSTVFSAATH